MKHQGNMTFSAELSKRRVPETNISQPGERKGRDKGHLSPDAGLVLLNVSDAKPRTHFVGARVFTLDTPSNPARPNPNLPVLPP